MIKNLLSRYSFRYPRALVYMLQAVEYNIGDYLVWYQRTKNFTHVEQRKQLVKTPKAVLLLTIAWVIIGLFYSLALYFLFNADFGYILFALILFAAPYLLAYGLAFLLLIITIFVQRPVGYYIVKQAQKRLKTHKGIKIAIAGSFGKTSMREILKTVLSKGKKVAAPPHSYNTPLSISQFIQSLEGDEEIVIFELGEYYPGDVRKLCQLVQPQIGIITGVNEAHLTKFKNLRQTTSTIFELSDWLGKKPLYINGENQLARNKALINHIFYSRNGTGEWKVENIHTDLTGVSFTLVKKNLKFQFKSKLIGLHQIGPLIAAIDIAYRLGMPLEQIQKGVANTKPFHHRLAPTTDENDIVTIDDSYNGNPDGVKVAIEFLGSLKNHKRFYVTPGLVEMGSRAKTVHEEIGKQLAQAKIENVILIKNSVTEYIERGLKKSNYEGKILWFDDALSTYAALPHLTIKGDVVLLQNDWPDQYQ